MFERYTLESRQVVVYALEEVRAFGHARVGSDHLLLALLRDPGVSELLNSLDVTYEGARAQVEEMFGLGEGSPAGQIPFTQDSKDVLTRAINDAGRLHQLEVLPEHILLALNAAVESVGAQILQACGGDPEAVRNAAMSRLADR